MKKIRQRCGCETTPDVVLHECGKGWRRDVTETGRAIERWLAANPGKCAIDYARVHGGAGTYI